MSMGFSLRLEHTISQQMRQDCAVCGEPPSSEARFTCAWSLSPEQLVQLGICPVCLSFPPAGGRDIPALRATWLAVTRPITRPGVGLPFDLI